MERNNSTVRMIAEDEMEKESGGACQYYHTKGNSTGRTQTRLERSFDFLKGPSQTKVTKTEYVCADCGASFWEEKDEAVRE